MSKLRRNRVCLASGYKYEYDGSPRSWAASGDSRWDTVMAKAVCGKRLGKKLIDGVIVTVVQARGKVYASQHARGGELSGARRRRR